MDSFDLDIVGSLFGSSSRTNNPVKFKQESESFSIDDATEILMRSNFNEAESEEIDWGSDESEEENNSSDEETDMVDSTEETEADVDVSENETSDDEVSDDELSDEELSDEEGDELSNEGKTMGVYSSIKEELDAEREILSEIYERFFKEIVEPLFRRLEDSNINVAFDTTSLLSSGIIRIELSHRNSDSSAEMEINIFANTVNGEFLGMENSDGEAIATSLENVSLDDLISILIKVLV